MTGIRPEEVVTGIVVNYQTPDLLQVAVESFRAAYPGVPLLIIDNGSQDTSRDVIMRMAEGDLKATSHLLDRNIFHGPAMHEGIRQAVTPYVYIFDSDTETYRSGFLESMLDILESDPRNYGVGQRVYTDRRGFAAPVGIPVLASAYMLLRRDTYLTLPPFVHHGLPALANFAAAHREGYHLSPFPIEDYVHHLGRGTAARYGYSLGLRSRVDYLLHRLGL